MASRTYVRTQTDIHTHASCNAVTLVWGSLRLAPITAIVLSFPDPDDLAFLMNHLQPMACHWKAFGLQLELLPGELDNIEATLLLIPGGPPAFLQAVLKRWMSRAPPFPTLSKLCDALRSCAVDQSRIALELEQQYQRWRTGLSAHKPHAGSDDQ